MNFVDILGCILYIILQTILIVSVVKVCALFVEGKFAISFITCIVWMSLNSFMGAIIYIIFGTGFNLMHILVALALYDTLLLAFDKKIKKMTWVKVKIFNDKKINIVFCVGTVLFFLVLIMSTNGTFMPIFGNVDEIVHYEFINGLNQKMWFEPQEVDVITRNMRLYDYCIAERASYTFGYHYIIASLSKLTFIDSIYLIHIVKCLIMAIALNIFLLLLKNVSNKKRMFCIIIYYVFIIGSVKYWYLYFSSGFSAQLFSIFYLFVSYILIKEFNDTMKSNVFIQVIEALLIWSTLNAYVLSGVILVSWYCLNNICKKRYRKLIGMGCAVGVFCLTPSIRNQILYFLFKIGNVDEAISASYASEKFITKAMLVVFVISIIIEIIDMIINKYIDVDISLVSAIAFVLLYLFGDRTSYVFYKLFITIFIIVITNMLFKTIKVLEIIKKKKLQYVVSFLSGIALIFICFKTNIVLYDDSISNKLANADVMIEQELYQCTDAIEELLDDGNRLEYIGVNGVATWYHGRINLGELTLSTYAYGGNRIIFTSEGAANYSRTLKGLTKIVETENVLGVVVVTNKSNKGMINKTFEKLVDERKTVYENDKYVVEKITFKDNYFISEITAEEIVEKYQDNCNVINVPNYGMSFLPSEVGYKNIIKLDVSEDNIKGLDISGRCIHNSDFQINIIDSNDEIHVINLTQFENSIDVDLSEYDVKEIELEVTAKNVASGIIISNILVYGYDE